jgi:hypothetical protein
MAKVEELDVLLMGAQIRAVVRRWRFKTPYKHPKPYLVTSII